MFRLVYESETDRKNHLLFAKRYIKGNYFTKGIPLFHGSIEFIFGLSGRSEIIIDEQKYDIEEGRIIFLNRFQKHNFNYLDGSQFYVVVISSDFFDGVNNLGRLSFPTVMEKTENFDKIKVLLDTCYSLGNMESMVFKTGFVNMLISVLCQNYPYTIENEQCGIYDVITEILTYVDENFRNDLSVSDVASKFGYSSNYFSTIFNKYLGMNFREYLNRRRMSEYTALRKENPKLSSCKAAELSGFRNLASFYYTSNKMKADSKIKDFEF